MIVSYTKAFHVFVPPFLKNFGNGVNNLKVYKGWRPWDKMSNKIFARVKLMTLHDSEGK